MTVVIEGLVKDFGDTLAVDDVSFEVPRGAVTGFVGANGSGKTTTMRMMLGLLPPTAGTVRFAGQRYCELDRPRTHVGAVIDRIGAHPSHSARRHLRMIARSAGLPLERVDQALEEVGLLDVADTQIGRYSMGMTQRCALAVALLGDPPVLILDEPANGLDPSGIRWLRERIRGWADDGRAVLVSTHQLAELAAVVDRLVVLDSGSVVFSGEATELITEGGSLEDAVFDLLAGTPSDSLPTRKAVTP